MPRCNGGSCEESDEGWTNTNRVIGFSSSEYLANGHPETTATGFNLVPGT